MNNIYINNGKGFLVFFFNSVRDIKGLIIKELNLVINYIFNNVKV